MKLNLMAASYRQTGHRIGGVHVAPLHEITSEQARDINKRLRESTGRLVVYFPRDLGKALLKIGIESEILAHSGRTVINGDYND